MAKCKSVCVCVCVCVGHLSLCTWNTVTIAHSSESKFFLSGTVSPVSVFRLNLQPNICIPKILQTHRERRVIQKYYSSLVPLISNWHTHLKMKMKSISSMQNVATLSMVFIRTTSCLRSAGMNRTSFRTRSKRKVRSTERPPSDWPTISHTLRLGCSLVNALLFLCTDICYLSSQFVLLKFSEIILSHTSHNNVKFHFEAVFSKLQVSVMIKTWLCLLVDIQTKIESWAEVSKIWTFINRGCIKFIKSDSEDVYNVKKKRFISNKCCSFGLSIHLWILKNEMHHGFHKNIVQHNCFQHW